MECANDVPYLVKIKPSPLVGNREIPFRIRTRVVLNSYNRKIRIRSALIGWVHEVTPTRVAIGLESSRSAFDWLTDWSSGESARGGQILHWRDICAPRGVSDWRTCSGRNNETPKETHW